MNLEVLLKEYANDPRCFKIVDGITLSKPQQIHLLGLHGSAAQFIIAAVFNHPAASLTILLF
jgi:transcription-repair coupling factor (superfamily II helicase)